MTKKILKTSLLTCVLLNTNLLSNDEISSIEVTSTFLQTTEKNATYATEIFTKKDIEDSKSRDLYEFLNTNSSLNISPATGSRFAQKIDLRGYGLNDGYQNLVISVDGRRLNNIDMVPQLLSSISLDSIEKIEILKGSGSVLYGDGANAGAINIITNGKNDNYVQTIFGSNNYKQGILSLGFMYKNFVLNGFVDYQSLDSFRQTNEKEKDFSRNKSFDIKYFVNEDLELRAGRSFSNIRTFYGGSLSLDDYKDDPNQVGGWTTKQEYDTYNTNLGLTYDINKNHKIDLDYNNEDKVSKYIGSSTTDYEYESFALKVNSKFDNLRLVSGVDGFYGDANGITDISKDNKAIFVSGNYSLNKNLTLSAGARYEEVSYLSKSAGDSLDDYLKAYDFGVNYQIDDENSIFANYNRGFQTADVNRLFKWDTGAFLGFVNPAISKTINLGYSNIQKNNKLKITVFRTDLTNEIYYYKVPWPGTSFNTNIDKSHKYGLEVYNKYVFNKNFSTSVNYAYLIAKIDEENEANGAYNGKDLPGVSKHNIAANLAYKYNKFNTILSHTYRSSSYALNDFENSFSQKQDSYHSTDLTFAYEDKKFDFFVKFQNLFAQDNGIWVQDDAIYPISYDRSAYVGLKVKF